MGFVLFYFGVGVYLSVILFGLLACCLGWCGLIWVRMRFDVELGLSTSCGLMVWVMIGFGWVSLFWLYGLLDLLEFAGAFCVFH